MSSHRRYYCEGAEVPEVAPACGCAELLGDRASGRGEAGSPPIWPCRSPSEPSTRIPNPREAATLDARDRGEDIGSCELDWLPGGESAIASWSVVSAPLSVFTDISSASSDPPSSSGPIHTYQRQTDINPAMLPGGVPVSVRPDSPSSSSVVASK
jgi:hypothetical protein